MEINIDVRKKQLESLDQFIASSKSSVQTVLECLDWDVDAVLNENSLKTCPFDGSHTVSEKNLDEHISKCLLHKQNYKLTENFLSLPTHPPGQYIIIDNETKTEIFTKAYNAVPNFKTAWNSAQPDPKTSDRYLSTYSADERLVLYDYAVSSTSGPPKLPEFNVLDDDQVNLQRNAQLTHTQLLLMERDAKRRRVKYKSVYTNHKSHSEVIRELIDSQMDQYEDWLQVKTNTSKSKSESGDAEDPEPKQQHHGRNNTMSEKETTRDFRNGNDDECGGGVDNEHEDKRNKTTTLDNKSKEERVPSSPTSSFASCDKERSNNISRNGRTHSRSENRSKLINHHHHRRQSNHRRSSDYDRRRSDRRRYDDRNKRRRTPEDRSRDRRRHRRDSSGGSRGDSGRRGSRDSSKARKDTKRDDEEASSHKRNGYKSHQ